MPDHDPPDDGLPEDAVSRRAFLGSVGGTLAAAALGTADAATQRPAARAQPAGPPPATGRRLRGTVRVSLKVNGAARTADVEPRTTLLDTLRDHLDLTGAKKVCDRGSCGACTVLLDGKPVYACMLLAVDAQGHDITTVEGLGSPDRMSPLQQAFVEHDALMCGFCTPGFVVAGTALLRKHPNPTREQVREGCAGNLCRCGTYPRVFEAIEAAAKAVRGGG